MDHLKKMSAICFLFAVWMIVTALISLSLFRGNEDPIRALVSQSCFEVKQFFS
jgi:hypothetical protein